MIKDVPQFVFCWRLFTNLKLYGIIWYHKETNSFSAQAIKEF